MRIFGFSAAIAASIMSCESKHAFALPVVDGNGELHGHAFHLDSSSVIGAHLAGHDQLFVVPEGAGLGSGAGNARFPISRLETSFIPSGELQSKGSRNGTVASMLQCQNIASLDVVEYGAQADAMQSVILRLER